MEREYWRPQLLLEAARALESAAKHVVTSYPHSASQPMPETLPAVRELIASARKLIEQAQPTGRPYEEAAFANLQRVK